MVKFAYFEKIFFINLRFTITSCSSLSYLKECIRALGRKGAHLPFRASKLTQVKGKNETKILKKPQIDRKSVNRHQLNDISFLVSV